MKRDAIISDCGRYRYRLSRLWSTDAPLVWIMLNPSTADATLDDPTIRRCMSFAQREGAGGIEVLNLFAYRATSPTELARTDDPIGPLNDAHIQEVLADHSRCICGWGAYPAWERAAQVMDLAKHTRFLCLGRTAAGHPKHPLYIAGSQPFIEWAV